MQDRRDLLLLALLARRLPRLEVGRGREGVGGDEHRPGVPGDDDATGALGHDAGLAAVSRQEPQQRDVVILLHGRVWASRAEQQRAVWEEAAPLSPLALRVSRRAGRSPAGSISHSAETYFVLSGPSVARLETSRVPSGESASPAARGRAT
jgi:hypothetical protein